MHQAAIAAEKVELSLSYSTTCKSESGRKITGSYYTPIDVADHFWNIFFNRQKISSRQDALSLLKRSIFIEPSVGSGSLFFSLLKKLIYMGVYPRELCEIDVDMIDINGDSLKFIGRQIRRLEKVWEVSFYRVNFFNMDFRNYRCNHDEKERVYFGNPPFVSNNGNGSKWRNLFADFVELSICGSVYRKSMHYILPLSVAFSRDYRELRQILRESLFEISIASYDNIPDTLFKSGKQKSKNTNKANSQRCVILTAIPSKKTKIYSSKLHRWNKYERSHILSSYPVYHNITRYSLDDQFVRPANKRVLSYLHSSDRSRRVSDLVSNDAKYLLYVSSVARNYIGFKNHQGSSCNVFGFATKEDFLVVLGLVSSDLFFEYWLTVGDGFHVTKSNVLNFPISENIMNFVCSRFGDIETFWRSRKKFRKVKLNSGVEAHSFDFSSVSLSLIANS